MELKLSDETLIGLKRLCNSTLVNDEKFKRLIDEFSNATVNNTATDKNESEEFKSDSLKTAYAALTILLTEAARHDFDGFRLKTMLEGYNLDADRIAGIVSSYEKGRCDLQRRLQSICTDLPHIVDIHWRLDYRIKSDHANDSELIPLVLVELVTLTPSNTTETVKFVCTKQNLQELVFSLKGAARHVSKLINPSK